MNYAGLSDDVAELFADAQEHSGVLPWWQYRRVVGNPSAVSTIKPLVAYDRGVCPRCGGPVEVRPGVRAPVHLGPPMTCADRRLRAAR